MHLPEEMFLIVSKIKHWRGKLDNWEGVYSYIPVHRPYFRTTGIQYFRTLSCSDFTSHTYCLTLNIPSKNA